MKVAVQNLKRGDAVVHPITGQPAVVENVAFGFYPYHVYTVRFRGMIDGLDRTPGSMFECVS